MEECPLEQLLHEELSGMVRQTAYETHRYFGVGFLERVYENALAHRLRRKGLVVSQQTALEVRDEDGTIVGNYVPDLIVNGCLIAEVKSVVALTDDHFAQVLNYLKVTGIELGLLMNFGTPWLEFRRVVLERDR